MMLALIIIFLLVLFLPLVSTKIEKNLELFLFVMGISAATFSGVFESILFVEATIAPVKISLAVLLAGLLFKWLHTPLKQGIVGISQKLPFRLFIALSVVLLGLLSSIITAIIAALVLVLMVSSLSLDKKAEIRFVILACFSIGLGASLTPIGEPLSTIAIHKLKGDFFLLIQLIGPEVLASIIIFAIVAAIMVPKPQSKQSILKKETNTETYDEIINRTLKIYFFVMGLTLLGAGFEPLIQEYFIGYPPEVLYWINMISAVLDNATLTATEISPMMDDVTVRAILLGLLISGGMLIPGNIPNIIAAGKLEITSKEWAKFGVPVGLIMMAVYYVVSFLIVPS
ncbi:DUF1646 family protein [Bacillus carboniphilus]|uniref:DUF1646 family protein n=1 Tax=Bacillus carboniphilus TaxID=86663 RepID=A0ABN0WAR5_9BACI